MSAPINDGGSAFPVDHQFVSPNATLEQFRNACGMSLRDYFAGQALIGVVFAPLGQGGRTTYSGTATDAYAYADAMLAARERKESAK